MGPGSRDKLIYEWQRTEEEMRGISPKLSSHQKLKTHLADLENRIGFRPAPRKTAGRRGYGREKVYTNKYNPRFL